MKNKLFIITLLSSMFLWILCPENTNAQRYNVHNKFTEDFGGPKPGFRYKIKNLKIEGKGNVYETNKGGEISVQMDLLHDCQSCGNAVNQVIVGLSSDDKAQVSVWNGKQRSGGGLKIVNRGTDVEAYAEDNPGKAQWVRVYFTLQVPNENGTYYIRTRYAQGYTGNVMTAEGNKINQKIMTEPLGWWKVDRPDGPGDEANVGVIIVTKKSKNN